MCVGGGGDNFHKRAGVITWPVLYVKSLCVVHRLNEQTLLEGVNDVGWLSIKDRVNHGYQ